MASEPLTPEMEKDIRDWLVTQDALYVEGGVWHGRKQEAHHIRLAAAVAEIDRLRAALKEIADYQPQDTSRYAEPYTEIAVVCKNIARAVLEGKL